MKLIFISYSGVWVEAMQTLFPAGEADTICGDVESLPVGPRTAFVSPANCLGFMDGGIDRVFSRVMFPGCEARVKQRIREIGFKTLLGRPYLPIGSAFIVPAKEGVGLICAPTMFLPHDVRNTRNAYHSFLAALAVFQKAGCYNTLVATSHCCGYGRMDPAESARQMREAYDDWLAGRVPHDTSCHGDTVLLPRVDEEQPDNYDNREIKVITIERLMEVLRRG